MWANGARREGHKVNGKWEGQVFYQYAEGPRKGKRDVETWKNGELISSQKFYGHGETIQINDWEDLKKLDSISQSEPDPTPIAVAKPSAKETDVYYDCISNE